jgi:hypothetical protein
MIHDTETQNYLEQARTRHVLVARAVDDSTPEVQLKQQPPRCMPDGGSTASITPT